MLEIDYYKKLLTLLNFILWIEKILLIFFYNNKIYNFLFLFKMDKLYINLINIYKLYRYLCICTKINL